MASTTTTHLQDSGRSTKPRAAKALGEFAALLNRAAIRLFTMDAEQHSRLGAAQEMSRVARHYELRQSRLAAELQVAARHPAKA